MLHHVVMFWIIENHDELKYDMDIQNSYLLTDGPWYNTYICKKLHGKLFEDLLHMLELTGITSCVLLINMKESINNLAVMMASVLGIVHYQQLQQQKHYNRSIKPYFLLFVG